MTPGNGLWLQAGITGVRNIDKEGNFNDGFNSHGDTNIVSSGMQVISPDGSSTIIPFYTDVFSPNVDFINVFRYLQGSDGSLPVAGGTYTFTLLDAFGSPIAGTTQTDTWYGCTMDAPRNVAASVNSDGISVTWDAVAPAPGFDPSASLGFYQIELRPANINEMVFGTGGIHSTNHLIPADGFGGSAHGYPDGEDFGKALSELDDGNYTFDVISFSEAPVPEPNVGPECQVRANAEQVSFEKSGGILTIIEEPVVPPEITIIAQPDHDWVDSFGWKIGDEITMYVDDNEPIGSQIATPADWDPNIGMVSFNNWGTFDLTPGMTVYLTDGTHTESLLVENLSVDQYDEALDTVSGSAPAGRQVGVGVHQSGADFWLITTADGGGHWVADFAAQGDYFSGVFGIHAMIWDADGNATQANYPFP